MNPTVNKYKTTYESLPQLQNVRMLWHSAYWDGPLSGMCLVGASKCWFELLEMWDDNNQYPDEDDPTYDDFERPWYRRYLVIKLSDSQVEELEKRHSKFQRMVGLHTDYDAEGKRSFFVLKGDVTRETVDQYYKETKTTEAFELEPVLDQHILGWWET